MLLYSRKCFFSFWFSPSTSSVISASSTVSGEMFTSVLFSRFTPRMLTPYFLRMSSSPMLRPCLLYTSSILNVPEDVFPYALLYLRIYLLGMPVILLYNFEAAIFQMCIRDRSP